MNRSCWWMIHISHCRYKAFSTWQLMATSERPPKNESPQQRDKTERYVDIIITAAQILYTFAEEKHTQIMDHCPFPQATKIPTFRHHDTKLYQVHLCDTEETSNLIWKNVKHEAGTEMQATYNNT